MINRIKMDMVASFKTPAVLETDRKINLIYGLNGTGKSTFSDFLYGRSDIDFSKCSIEPTLNDETKVLVFNRTFIYDNFYESEAQHGIFSLSKENKDAQEKIDNAKKEIGKIEEQITLRTEAQKNVKEEFEKQKNAAVDKIWEIKTTYTGGDRILDFCLAGLNRAKEKPFEFILPIPKPSEKPPQTIEQLKQEAQLLSDNDAEIQITIPVISFSASAIEKDSILAKVIVGDSNSSVSELIKKLNNQNWVQEGLSFVDAQATVEQPCPFCQKNTITPAFVNELNAFFAGEYERDRNYIKSIGIEYSKAIENISNRLFVEFEQLEILKGLKKDIETAKEGLLSLLNKNLERLREKWKTPNNIIILQDSAPMLQALNEIIIIAQSNIKNFNAKISKKSQAQQKIKDEFWSIQRWEYDQTISLYKTNLQDFTKKDKEAEASIEKLEKSKKKLQNIIIQEQKKVINVQEAVEHINANLLGIGIDYFKIEQYQENLYHITRSGQSDGIFKTLSEGEKMMISFLYFIELCNGKQDAAESEKAKIIVIDDPISSLSHIYVFNVGKLIESEFLRADAQYEQVFILTHSLYFFHELHKLSPRPSRDKGGNISEDEKKKKIPALFRLIKNNSSSSFGTVKANEILNDYQTYWAIVKDPHASPALIANAMRNIIEYFFGFIEKKDLNAVFQKPKLQDNKYQAFNRFINAESHLRPTLIYDYKEFDYDLFREAFHLVFSESDYEGHYLKMME